MASLTRKKLVSGTVKVVQVLCAIHLFNEHVAEIRPCAGASMHPTLPISGGFILHSPLYLRFGGPVPRGALVTAISPLDPSHQVLKRVVGLPGDSVCVDPSGERGRQGEWTTVGKGTYWLAGDNMSNSTDSRDYGAVPAGLLKGRVVARIWPDPSWLEPNMRKVDSF